MEKEKRITAHLIPYKLNASSFFFFLQKRSDAAARNPGWFSIFGGGVEKGESPAEAMIREIKEELDEMPKKLPSGCGPG